MSIQTPEIPVETSALPPYLRLKGSPSDAGPLLTEILDALPGRLTRIFQSVAGCDLAVHLKGRKSSYVGVVLDNYQGRAIASEFSMEGWECSLQILIERRALYALLEVSLGGVLRDRETHAERPFTTLEASVAQLFCESVAAALQDSLADIPDVALAFGRVERRLDLLTHDDKAGLGLLAEFALEIGGPCGSLFMVVPPDALSKFQTAASIREGQGADMDTRWIEAFRVGVEGAPVKLNAIIREESFTVADVARMRAGQVLRLGRNASERLALVAEGRELMRCSLGRDEENYTLRVKQIGQLASQEPV